MSIGIIKQVEPGNRALLAKREQYWQYQLWKMVEQHTQLGKTRNKQKKHTTYGTNQICAIFCIVCHR